MATAATAAKRTPSSEIQSLVATLAERQSDAPKPSKHLTGPEKAAVLMLALGEQHGAKTAIIYEDPANDDVNDNTALVALSHGLDQTFVSARDQMFADGQWARAKGYDTFCALGPWISTELDVSDLRVSTELNGEPKQDGRTSQFIFDIPEVLVHLRAQVVDAQVGSRRGRHRARRLRALARQAPVPPDGGGSGPLELLFPDTGHVAPPNASSVRLPGNTSRGRDALTGRAVRQRVASPRGRVRGREAVARAPAQPAGVTSRARPSGAARGSGRR